MTIWYNDNVVREGGPVKYSHSVTEQNVVRLAMDAFPDKTQFNLLVDPGPDFRCIVWPSDPEHASKTSSAASEWLGTVMPSAMLIEN